MLAEPGAGGQEEAEGRSAGWLPVPRVGGALKVPPSMPGKSPKLGLGESALLEVQPQVAWPWPWRKP